MPPAAPRPCFNSFNSSSLVRFLSGLDSATDVGHAPQTFAERLSLWMGWTDAIALSAALNTATATAIAVPARTALAASAQRLADTGARLRLQLAQSIQRDGVLAVKAPTPFTPSTARGAAPPPLDAPHDFAPYHRQYQIHQRAMEAAIAPLRAQWRVALATGTPGQARLAALDAVLDKALEARERQLLATVPGWLEKHFNRLRQRHRANPATDAPPAALPQAAAPPWWPRCGPDLQTVLMAELDLRCLPLQGLQAAATAPHNLPPA